jgi:thiamine-monophosphate kinase
VSWTEDRIHRRLAASAARFDVRGSRGHDAAVLETRGKTVLCVDQTIEGVHFRRDAPPRLVGRKAAARALSDLAATAARPRAILVALSAPPSRSSKWIEAVLAGARSMARECGAELVGGDLACARGPAAVSVAAFGAFEARGRPPGRDRARAGQVVVLTGPVGGSSAGRHLRFRPRIAEGIALHAAGATAMMDTTDGLAWDLFRLARASRVRVDLDLAAVPVHREARSLEHALADGEDYELLATLDDAALARARRALPSLRAIGRVRAGAGLWLADAAGRARRWRRSEGGYEHGR